MNPSITIVFASTRQVYGRPRYLPVDENHPLQPTDVNGISKAAAEAFHLLYGRVYNMRCCCLRLTNTYGPRMRIADSNQSFIGGWIRAAIEGRALEIWGGEQLRDLTYVDDVVDALLLAALNGNTLGKALNVDGDNPVSLRHIAEAIIETSGDGQAEVR